MNYIEFIGPQGAGKTTLMKKLVKHRCRDANWCTFDEAIIEIGSQVRWKDLNQMEQRLFWLMRKADLFDHKINGLSHRLVRSLREQENLEMRRRYEYLVEAQFKALAELDIDISPINLFSLMRWNYMALERAFLLEEFNFPKTVVMDEGPFKTHYGLSHIKLENVVKDTLPAAVLYVKIDKKKNVDRIINRYKETGNLSCIHNSINREGVPVVTEKLHKILEENIKIIRKLGIPVMELDLGAPIDEDVIGSVGEFINLYSGNITRQEFPVYP